MFGSICRVVRQAMFVALIVILMFKQSSELGAQENWSRFHGPNGSGLALDSKIPAKITPEDVRWKVSLAGVGSSSPVIWGDRLFTTSCDLRTGKLTVQCFNVASGEQIWSKEFQQQVYRVHGRNSFASSTPAVDAEHVYLTFADPKQTVLMALDHDGNEKWKRDFGTWISQHGFGVSPMVYQDKVIFFNSQLAAGGETGESRVIAVACKDGSDVWTSSLKATKSCYAVPCIFKSADGKEQLVSCNTGDGFFSLDPGTGKMNWSTLPFKMRTVASTLVADGMIIGSNGSGGGGNYLVAIRPDQNDSSAEPAKAYEVKRANYVPSPVAVDGRLFLFSDKGIAQCVDLQTGEQLWQKRMARGFSGSPVATAEHIYILDESGKLFVIDAKPEYKEVCTLELGESSRSTPAIVGDRMFLRTDSHLICIGKK
ncbi:MAG: outer membrane protein assembly factor BamB [Mariniblastus sp.]|jgi:outer membrane protein assembly factor BamB